MKTLRIFSIIAVLAVVLSLGFSTKAIAQADNPNPPDQIVKLIFIHHSSGENWLIDEHGGLALELQRNNYFVSDTNYGWGPDGIGDRTDIPNWLEWFRSDLTPTYMDALFNESAQNSGYTRIIDDPGGENQIVMFKSCFPNSNLEGNPDDAAAQGEDFTVANAKYVYNEILKYFLTRPDKLFILITAPPVQDSTYGHNARAFNDWLVNDWLTENGYPYSNVAVFDFYNVLTDPGNHHRYQNGVIEHITDQGGNTLYYPTDGDDHANSTGTQKATQEFVPLLNVYYHRWIENQQVQPEVATPTEEYVEPTEVIEEEVEISTNTPEVGEEVEETAAPTQEVIEKESEEVTSKPERKGPRLCTLPMTFGLLMAILVTILSRKQNKN